jgi:hypothetical protein
MKVNGKVLFSLVSLLFSFSLCVTPAKAEPLKPLSGVFSLLPLNNIPSDLTELGSPDVTGISARFTWSAIEPSPGVYDWRAIDRAISKAQSSGKKLMLRISAGIYSPKWLYKSGVPTIGAVTAPVNYEEPNPQRQTLAASLVTSPIVWDHTYLHYWERLIKNLGQRYDGNPVIVSIQMTGGGVTAEMTLYTQQFDWLSRGYSDEIMISTWKFIIDAYQANFPTTLTNLNILEPIRGVSHVVDPVVDYCLSLYPGKVSIQNNGLNARGAACLSTIQRAALLTQVGYQMSGGNGWLSETVGDREQAFIYALTNGATYVEVYHTDLIDETYASDVHLLSQGLVQNYQSMVENLSPEASFDKALLTRATLPGEVISKQTRNTSLRSKK